jgi:opacity protein-like surface antigen
MKTINSIGLLVLLLFAGLTVQAQSRFRLNLNYNVSVPAGNFRDFIEETSWRGWTGNLLYGINDRLSVGLGTGFQDYYEKFPRAVYKLREGGEISAVVTNSIQTIPLLAVAQYNFLPRAVVQPYVGVGVGGNIIVFDQYLGEFSNSESTIGFALRPEVGLQVPIGKRGFSANVNGMYNYMPYTRNNMDGLHNWAVGAGIRFSLR